MSKRERAFVVPVASSNTEELNKFLEKGGAHAHVKSISPLGAGGPVAAWLVIAVEDDPPKTSGGVG
jgi:hypothetical protein